jgi:UDP-N-acetylmuramate dehydrogenase
MKPFQQRRSLSEFSTFGIGGIARYFTEVDTVEELQELMLYCKAHALPFRVIGKGSNSLFPDAGFEGLVLLNKISFCEIQDRSVSVGAGFSFSLLGAKTARKGLSGLEFASGIPGTVGGAIYMNAGANGGETADTLKEVTYVDDKGNCLQLPREDLTFSYRTSPFHKMTGVIATAAFELIPDPQARAKQLSIVAYRTRTQPYGDQSCGCIFRNPEGEHAGALIEKCGLKGMKIGGAEVSVLHGNFIVNREKATAKEVLELAQYIQKRVKELTGIELEMELNVIPSGISS